MGFSMWLSKNMWYVFISTRVNEMQPFTTNRQLPLFFDKETASEFPRKLKDCPAEYGVVQMRSWDQLLKLLEQAKVDGVDSVVFVRKDKEPQAALIEHAIDHVRDVVTGKHKGNPTNPN